MEIVADIKATMNSEFCHSTSHEEFKTMQTLWRGEIQKKFVELKKMEIVSISIIVWHVHNYPIVPLIKLPN